MRSLIPGGRSPSPARFLKSFSTRLRHRFSAVFFVGCIAVGAMINPAMAVGKEPSERPLRELPELLNRAPTIAITKRVVALADLLQLRHIEAFELSPDGSKFVLLVRQADAHRNSYHLGWFVGSTATGHLRYLTGGGDIQLVKIPTGGIGGDITGGQARWSHDGTAVAFTTYHGDVAQLWRVQIDRDPRPLHASNPGASVLGFAWSPGDKSIIYSTGVPEAELAAKRVARERAGFAVDDFQVFTDIVYHAFPTSPPLPPVSYWLSSAGSVTRRASQAETRLLSESDKQSLSIGANTAQQSSITNELAERQSLTFGMTGNAAWLQPAEAADKGIIPNLTLAAKLKSAGNETIICGHVECTGQFFQKEWWVGGSKLLFWRKIGTNEVSEDALYEWDVADNGLRLVYSDPSSTLQQCQLVGMTVSCVRETRTAPSHLAQIDIRSGRVRVLTDINPEFRNIDIGRTERIEWQLPADTAGLGYPKKGFGYVIYPPGFDPRRKYPVFIAPYSAVGFPTGDAGNEQPLLAYAASGIIVLNTEFPEPFGSWATRHQTDTLAIMYSEKLGFPHLSMLADSTLRALDKLAARGFVDLSRVGIGGVSQGTYVSLFMLQKYDRLAAVSVAQGSWNLNEYYFVTPLGLRNAELAGGAGVWPSDPGYWSEIDLGENVQSVEAPILFNFADREFFYSASLPKRLQDAGRAVDAYIYPNEYHFKWQPAHREVIYQRNLDWFRFWLLGEEDLAPDKVAQYLKWRNLRSIECVNPRAQPKSSFCKTAARE
ncbi:MAG: hypothetical protein JWR80_9137 [Bradyrhizobium sp.]|nr:hypothetical protein [Bradyrhizobium sp.]